MATIERRVSDLETMLAHLPEDLDTRFEGAERTANARHELVIARINTLERKLDAILERLPKPRAKK